MQWGFRKKNFFLVIKTFVDILGSPLKPAIHGIIVRLFLGNTECDFSGCEVVDEKT